MTRRLTKAEQDQRVLEYRIVWLQGYGVGYNKAAEIIPDSGQLTTVLWQMTDPKIIKRVQKATRDLYDGSLQPTKKDIEKIGETLGEATHNAWLEMRKAEGWHHPKDCPYNGMYRGKTCSNCHDCMVPYSEVPPDRKKIAQSYPEQFFKIITEMGYQIIKDK